MKATLVFFIAIEFIFANCYVAKNVDISTTPSNNHSHTSETKSSEKKRESLKVFSVNDSRVYLEDVLFALKNQNWTEQEQPCLQRTLLLLHNLQNFTLWAVWDWDSISSEPQGLLFGSRFHLGNFDECMTAPWYSKHPELRPQYCLADIELERTDKAVKKRISDPFDPYQSALNVLEHKSVFKRTFNTLTWGICVPSQCQPRSVEKLTGILLAHSHLGAAGMRARISVNDECQKVDESIPFDGLFYGFIAMTVIFIFTALICTYLSNKRETSNEKDLKSKVIAAFDLQGNAKSLCIAAKDQKTTVFYGIKFLTICIVVSGHHYGIFNGGPVSNGYVMDQDIESIYGMMILHQEIVVDSFFVLSGFLTAAQLSTIKRLPNIFLLFFRRYVRLMVAYIIVIFYICAIFPYIGSGPLWKRAVAEDTDYCRKNWWLNVLMLSNYIDTWNMCLVISWYIPCDYHFFVLTITLFYVYKRNPKSAGAVMVFLLIAAILTPGILNYVHKLPAIQIFAFDFISNPRSSTQFHLTYIKSHTRYAPYLIGFISGYIYTRYTASDSYKKIPTKWSSLGAVLSLLVMTVIFVTGAIFTWSNYGVLEGALYAALKRPIWATSLILLVMCCSLGHVPFIKSFLSWSAWVPLSRLSYGLYIVHTTFISRNVYAARNPQHHDYFNLTTSWFGILAESCFAAFMIWLFAEAPINNLLKICFTPRIDSKKEMNSTEIEDQHTNKGYERNSECRHLEDNLPTTVQISSKI